MEPVVISVRGISKRYSRKDAASWTSLGLMRDFLRGLGRRLRRESAGQAAQPEDEFWALKDISFDVTRGQRIGIIGRNGAGKSTLLKIFSRLVHPTAGEIRIRGRVTSLLEVGTGFNMNLSGRDNIYLNASLHGLEKEEIDGIFDSIVEFSEIGDFIDMPVKHYSSGMYMRLAFAVAAHLDADILILDEVLAVGDMAFQRKCLERVNDMTSSGRTLLFVSHSMDAITRYCDRCIWLNSGRVVMDGDVHEVVSAYAESVLNVRPRFQLEAQEDTRDSAVISDAVRCVKETNNTDGDNPGLEVKTIQSITEQSNSVGEKEHALHGGASAHLLAASIIDVSGQLRKVFCVDETVGVEIVYEVQGEGMCVPGIHVYCPQDTLVFVAVPPENDPSKFRYGGPVRLISRAWLPANFFNIGTYSISLVVFSPLEAPLLRYFTYERALSFHCVEASDGLPSAKGIMPRGFPGPTRPKLQWTIEKAKIV